MNPTGEEGGFPTPSHVAETEIEPETENEAQTEIDAQTNFADRDQVEERQTKLMIALISIALASVVIFLIWGSVKAKEMIDQLYSGENLMKEIQSFIYNQL
jgi:hypothetical protein